MNDYELVYMYRRNLNSDLVFEILAKKYHKLIFKHINRVTKTKFDEYYNESLYVLLNALRDFDESFNKTFTRYFEQKLSWHLTNSFKYEAKTRLMEYEDDYIENIIEEKEEVKLSYDFSLLSAFESTIYEAFFVKKMKIKKISLLLNVNSKVIYNAIGRIRQKVREANKPLD